MSKVRPKKAHEGIEVAVSHSFDNELLVLREKEERTTFALRFTSFENFLLVLFRI